MFHPDRYHGWGKTKTYFEGWYFKLITADEQNAFAIIPGIAMNDAGEKHAFIQLLDGKAETAEYFTFPFDAFQAHASRFEVKIAGNVFTGNSIELKLPQLRGRIQFTHTVPWPSNWYSPGIMGPYSFVPFMECYHGIVSMNHGLEGQLDINQLPIDFTGGRGYTEKDWGHSFPSAYIWMQSNHYSQPGISFKASVAKIPWLRSSFVGFIAGLYVEQKLIQFTTYNHTKLLRSFANKNKVELILENHSYRLEVLVRRSSATQLASPIAGFMDGRISESMSSEMEIKLFNKQTHELIFHDRGRNTALEVAGKIEEIMI